MAMKFLSASIVCVIARRCPKPSGVVLGIYGKTRRKPTLSKIMKYFALLLICATLNSNLCAADRTSIRLWEKGAPGTPATKAADEPVIYMTPPQSHRTKTAVIILPGGGYGHLAITYEGHDVADWFNSFGVTAFVLKYRMHATGHMHPVPMMDGQRAIRTVRARAEEWGIDPAQIGVLGFSAGGTSRARWERTSTKEIPTPRIQSSG